jgi:hypothetical protein
MRPTNSAQAFVPIKPGRPFYGMVSTFMASAMGIGPYFDPVLAQKATPTSAAVFFGFHNPMSVPDMMQAVNQSLGRGMTPVEGLNMLCCMLMISAFKVVKAFVDNTPEFQAFFHLHSAAYHGNKFTFKSDQPKYPAAWRTFRIDETKKGNINPLHGRPCFGTTFGPADVLLLLSDIDRKLA